jgi:hypothetical protein
LAKAALVAGEVNVSDQSAVDGLGIGFDLETVADAEVLVAAPVVEILAVVGGDQAEGWDILAD